MSPSARSRSVLCLTVLSAVACLSGCGEEPFEARVLACAELTGAYASPNADLRARLAVVEQQRGLPKQLAALPGPDADNAAAALSDAYSKPLHLRLGPKVDELLEEATPTRRAIEFLDQNRLLIEKTANAVDLPRCRFHAEHESGFFGGMTYLDDASLAVGLLLLRGGEAARTGEPARAIADLRRALRVAHRLSRVRRIEARVLAGTLRARSLAHAERQFLGGALHHREAELLYADLRDQLADWPSDRLVLSGERATVLHAYEAIRAGMIDQLMTLAERQRLTGAGVIGVMDKATPEQIDADQTAYLLAMERLLEAADLPHYERLGALEQALGAARSGPLLFAEPLFLQDLPEMLTLIAADCARVEAWTIALSAAATLRTPPFRENPVTGGEYVVRPSSDGVAVALGEDKEPIIVLPDLSLR